MSSKFTRGSGIQNALITWEIAMCNLRNTCLLCVNICTVRCFSVLLLTPPTPVRLLQLWVPPAHHSQILVPPLNPGVGPWSNNSTPSSKWYGRDSLQPQNQWVWMGLCCYQLFWDISNVFDVLWSYFLIVDISLVGMCFLCGGLNGFRLELGQMLKFGFQYLLYIWDKYSNVLKMLSKFCYGLYTYVMV